MFAFLLQPEYANICFWYIPPSLRDMEKGPEYWQQLNQVRLNSIKVVAIEEENTGNLSLFVAY